MPDTKLQAVVIATLQQSVSGTIVAAPLLQLQLNCVSVVAHSRIRLKIPLANMQHRCTGDKVMRCRDRSANFGPTVSTTCTRVAMVAIRSSSKMGTGGDS